MKDQTQNLHKLRNDKYDSNALANITRSFIGQRHKCVTESYDNLSQKRRHYMTSHFIGCKLVYAAGKCFYATNSCWQ